MIEKKDINYEGASSFKDFETFLKKTLISLWA
jgi:hypothetical protein